MEHTLPLAQFSKVEKKFNKMLNCKQMVNLVESGFINLSREDKKFLSKFNKIAETHGRIRNEITSSNVLTEENKAVINEYVQALAAIPRVASFLARMGRPVSQGLVRIFGRSRLGHAVKTGTGRSKAIARNALRRTGRGPRVPKRPGVGKPIPKAIAPNVSRAAHKFKNVPQIRRMFSTVGQQCRIMQEQSGALGRCRAVLSRAFNWFKGFVSKHFRGTWKEIFGAWLSTIGNVMVFEWVWGMLKGFFGFEEVEEKTEDSSDLSLKDCYDSASNVVSFEQLLEFMHSNGLTEQKHTGCNPEVKAAIVALEEHLGITPADGVFDADVAFAAISAGLMTQDEDPGIEDDQDIGNLPSGQEPTWCHKARHQTEKTICNTQELWGYEQRNIELCKKSNCVKTDRAAVIAFIKERNSCGANVECIKKVYRKRILQLGGGSAAPVRMPAKQPQLAVSPLQMGTGLVHAGAPMGGFGHLLGQGHQTQPMNNNPFNAMVAGPIFEYSDIKKRFKKLLK